jgi:hypothetical protein
VSFIPISRSRRPDADVEIPDPALERCRVALSLKRLLRIRGDWRRTFKAPRYPLVTSVLSPGRSRLECGVEGLIQRRDAICRAECRASRRRGPVEVQLQADAAHQRMGLSMKGGN